MREEAEPQGQALAQMMLDCDLIRILEKSKTTLLTRGLNKSEGWKDRKINSSTSNYSDSQSKYLRDFTLLYSVLLVLYYYHDMLVKL